MIFEKFERFFGLFIANELLRLNERIYILTFAYILKLRGPLASH